MGAAPKSPFQVQKWEKHSDLIQGRQLSLHGGPFNASYDFNGLAKIDDVVRFTLTFGQRATLKGKNGRADSDVIISYLPEIIGSGMSQYLQTAGNVPCSGVCLMSPASDVYSHSYPVLDDWVQPTFKTLDFKCARCKTATGFGQPICAKCYQDGQWDWISYLNGNYP